MSNQTSKKTKEATIKEATDKLDNIIIIIVDLIRETNRPDIINQLNVCESKELKGMITEFNEHIKLIIDTVLLSEITTEEGNRSLQLTNAREEYIKKLTQLDLQEANAETTANLRNDFNQLIDQILTPVPSTPDAMAITKRPLETKSGEYSHLKFNPDDSREYSQLLYTPNLTGGLVNAYQQQPVQVEQTNRHLDTSEGLNALEKISLNTDSTQKLHQLLGTAIAKYTQYTQQLKKSLGTATPNYTQELRTLLKTIEKLNRPLPLKITQDKQILTGLLNTMKKLDQLFKSMQNIPASRQAKRDVTREADEIVFSLNETVVSAQRLLSNQTINPHIDLPAAPISVKSKLPIPKPDANTTPKLPMPAPPAKTTSLSVTSQPSTPAAPISVAPSLSASNETSSKPNAQENQRCTILKP